MRRVRTTTSRSADVGASAGRPRVATARAPSRKGSDQRSSLPKPLQVTTAIKDGARLAALRNLELLDSGPEETIERFTGLATELLGVPVSLVSLLDEARQYFVAEVGLVGEWAEARQTPLSHSFCQYAVATHEPFVVSDARKHPLVSENLAIRDLGVIAYAGIPLILKDGNAVGTLCAIDSEPRDWTERDMRILADLAAAVEAILDLRAALVQQGLHDPLTGLPNRDLLVAYCAQLIEKLHDREMVAVMCAGIDHFTQINQAFGTDRERPEICVGVVDG